MAKHFLPFLRFAYYLNAVFVLVIYGVTYWGAPPWNQWLYKISRENGPFEVASALFLLLISLWCAYLIIKHLHRFTRLEKLGIVSLCVLAFVGAGEELSWGQHWLKFQPDEFFIEHNLQQEANLHNFINAMVFSTIINVVFYGLFVFLPLGYYLFPTFKPFALINTHQLSHLIPGIHCTLMMLFANLHHAWLLPITYSDTIALGVGLVGAIWLLCKKRQFITLEQWAFLAFTLVFAGLCVLFADIFRHKNTQYEIRECLMIFVVGYWLMEWTLNKLSPGQQATIPSASRTVPQ